MAVLSGAMSMVVANTLCNKEQDKISIFGNELLQVFASEVIVVEYLSLGLSPLCAG